MVTTQRTVEAVVLLNPHLHHLMPFSFGKLRSRTLSQGDMSFIPVPGAATTLQAMSALNLTMQIGQYADPSGRAI
jgi:hypothetical protein